MTCCIVCQSAAADIEVLQRLQRADGLQNGCCNLVHKRQVARHIQAMQ